jgi:hypothetical protein
MTKRQRSSSNASEATTIIIETPEPLSHAGSITKSYGEGSILICIGERVCLAASQYALVLIPWFRDFFSREQRSITYYLPDEGTSAHGIFFSILHHETQDLPNMIFMTQLVDLATVCYKYDVAHIVVPHVKDKRWIEHLWEENKACGKDWITWMQILTGLYNRFDGTEQDERKSTILDVMAANIREIEGQWSFEWNGYRRYITEIDFSRSKIVNLSGE